MSSTAAGHGPGAGLGRLGTVAHRLGAAGRRARDPPVVLVRRPARPGARIGAGAAATGLLATAALLLYLLATRQELLTIAVVLSSLYPVIPVLLGATVLRERIGRGRAVGLVAAGMAVVLVAVG